MLVQDGVKEATSSPCSRGPGDATLRALSSDLCAAVGWGKGGVRAPVGALAPPAWLGRGLRVLS